MPEIKTDTAPVKTEAIPEKEKIVTEVKKEVIPDPPMYKKELDKKLSISERIIAYIESRKTDAYVTLNPFLKSLYPAPLPGAKPEHERITALASLRHLLVTMEQEGKIVFSTRNHTRIGQNYYNTGDPVTKHHNLTSLVIEARLP